LKNTYFGKLLGNNVYLTAKMPQLQDCENDPVKLLKALHRDVDADTKRVRGLNKKFYEDRAKATRALMFSLDHDMAI
jgi:hypothetical protein